MAIVIHTIGNNRYAYEHYRDGTHIRSKYIGPVDSKGNIRNVQFGENIERAPVGTTTAKLKLLYARVVRKDTQRKVEKVVAVPKTIPKKVEPVVEKKVEPVKKIEKPKPVMEKKVEVKEPKIDVKPIPLKEPKDISREKAEWVMKHKVSQQPGAKDRKTPLSDEEARKRVSKFYTAEGLPKGPGDETKFVIKQPEAKKVVPVKAIEDKETYGRDDYIKMAKAEGLEFDKKDIKDIKITKEQWKEEVAVTKRQVKKQKERKETMIKREADYQKSIKLQAEYDKLQALKGTPDKYKQHKKSPFIGGTGEIELETEKVIEQKVGKNFKSKAEGETWLKNNIKPHKYKEITSRISWETKGYGGSQINVANIITPPNKNKGINPKKSEYEKL